MSCKLKNIVVFLRILSNFILLRNFGNIKIGNNLQEWPACQLNQTIIVDLTMSYKSSAIVGFGAVVHFAPALKYSLIKPLYARYSKNLDLHAIGASMISSPTTSKISRGIAAYKPCDLKSGVS